MSGLLKFKHTHPNFKFLDIEVGAELHQRIIVRVKGGAVIEIDNIPDDTEIEVRDYDIPKNTDEDEIFNDQEGDFVANCFFGKETDNETI